MPQKTQLLILDSLHTFHAARCMAMFARKADETEEERKKRWGTFNDALRRIIFGTYKATSLPSYIQTEIRELGTLEIIFYSAHPRIPQSSHLQKTNKLDPLLGIFDLEHKINALPATHCDPNDSATLFVIEKCVA